MFLGSSPLCFIRLSLLDPPVDPPVPAERKGVHGQLASIDPNFDVFAVEILDVKF